MSEQPTSKRISELPKTAYLNDADIIPLSIPADGSYQSKGGNISALRSHINFENGVMSVAEGLGATAEGQYFHVYQSAEKLRVTEYINTGGVAVATGNIYPTGVAAALIESLIGTGSDNFILNFRALDGTPLIAVLKNGTPYIIGLDDKITGSIKSSLEGIAANPIVSTTVDIDKDNISTITKDGKLWLRGLPVALQDVWVIKNDQTIRDGISKVNDFYQMSSLAEIQSVIDGAGMKATTVTKDGKLWLRGLVTALQDIYAITHQQELIDAIAKIKKWESDGFGNSKGMQKTYYATDNAGELFTHTLTVSRATRNTGYLVNGWPQGKTCTDSTGRIYQGWNHASGHGVSDAVSAVAWSDDMGVTWSKPVDIVKGKVNARGTDFFALGVDDSDHLWAIVRNRGTSNAVGSTYHELYKSTDRGASWVLIGVISVVTQTISAVEMVPELFHDFVFSNGTMFTGYHFNASSRLGILSFDINDPMNTFAQHDLFSHGDAAYPTATTLCELTLGVDKAVGVNYLYGGIRTQNTAFPAKYFYLRDDFTEFTYFDAPESVRYSPMPIKRIGNLFVGLTMERYSTGVMNLWFCSPADFYSGATAKFYKMKIGQALRTPISSSGSTNQGVQSMEVVGEYIYLAWAQQAENTSTDIYCASFRPFRSDSFITYENLERL